MSKLTEAQRNALASNQFVFPKTRKYPIDQKGRAQFAIKVGGINLGRGILSLADYNKIVKAVNTRWGFNAKFKTKI